MSRGIKKQTQSQSLGKIEDLKLKKLFRLRNSRGDVDSKDLTHKKVNAIQEQYSPDRLYRNFALLFRNKARKWNLNEVLLGPKTAQGMYLTLALVNFVFIVFTNCFNYFLIK